MNLRELVDWLARQDPESEVFIEEWDGKRYKLFEPVLPVESRGRRVKKIVLEGKPTQAITFHRGDLIPYQDVEGWEPRPKKEALYMGHRLKGSCTRCGSEVKPVSYKEELTCSCSRYWVGGERRDDYYPPATAEELGLAEFIKRDDLGGLEEGYGDARDYWELAAVDEQGNVVHTFDVPYHFFMAARDPDLPLPPVSRPGS